jgi:peptidoglycan/LPS O-acetylase OafA/YrhL
MRFRAVDSFRGIAAIMVILFHMQHLNLLSENVFIAKSDIFVDFFFVLSGFVMTHSNFNKITDLRSIKPFVSKRFKRLYPLHLFTLLLVLLFEVVRFGIDRYVVHLSNPVFADDKTLISFLANLTLTQSLGIVDRVTWNGPSWSISVEFYTYIAWALCLVLFRKNVLLICIIGFSLLAWFIVQHHGSIIYNHDYGFVRCLYSFLIGMVSYRISRQLSSGFGYWQSTATEGVILGLTIFSVRSFTHPESWMMPLLFAIVIIAFSRETGAISKFLAIDRLEFLGKLSYSYYLNHTIVLAIMDLLLFKIIKVPHTTIGELFYVLSCLGFVHLLSVFTYRHIELILQSPTPKRPQRSSVNMTIASLNPKHNWSMNILKAPTWISEFNYPYATFDEVPKSVFDSINRDLDAVQSHDPLVSVVIPGWNEEVNILRSVASLAKMKTDIPFEIVVVNNNSTDQMQKTLDNLHVRSVFQPIQGWGPARQMGLENARGKYILTADADGLYPPEWVNEMMAVLQQPGVVCVYGRYSFIPTPEKGFSRCKISFLETLKDGIAEVRHMKRPHLNAYGISIGYIREYGLKVGYVMHKIRGEDGRMCFDLMNYGSVKQVKSAKARAWTGTRTLEKDGSFSRTLFVRIANELRRFSSMFVAQPPHDTKTSLNN